VDDQHDLARGLIGIHDDLLMSRRAMRLLVRRRAAAAGPRVWRLDNVIISPHVGGYGDPHLLEGLARHFRANLDRFLAGQPLQDHVSLA
jgi:hypothetical protein